MESNLDKSKPVYLLLLAFTATAVASIALQNIIWLAVVAFLFAAWRNHEKINWPKGLFPLATLLFMATFFLGAIVGIDPHNSFHGGRVYKYLAILLAFFIGAMPLDFGKIRSLLSVFVYGASFCALYGIIYKHFILHEERIESFSGDKMVFGGMLMVALLLNLALLKENPRKWQFWVCAALNSVALVFTQTRGAWVGFFVGFILLLWKLNRKWLWTGLGILFISLLTMPHSIQSRVESMGDISFSLTRQDGQIVNASQPRFLIWVAGLRIIKHYPWGIGQGNLDKVYPIYRVPNNDLEPNVPHLHNDFLQILAQNGWIGFSVYVVWIFAYFREGFRYGNGSGPAELNWAFLCIFFSILVWGLTEYTFSHQFMNIQFFLLGLQIKLWKDSSRG
jgi:O-antigen ligase